MGSGAGPVKDQGSVQGRAREGPGRDQGHGVMGGSRGWFGEQTRLDPAVGQRMETGTGSECFQGQING